jgi:hypothetical protein
MKAHPNGTLVAARGDRREEEAWIALLGMGQRAFVVA